MTVRNPGPKISHAQQIKLSQLIQRSREQEARGISPIEAAVNRAALEKGSSTTGQYDMAGLALEHLDQLGAENLDDDILVVGVTVYDLMEWLTQRFGVYWYTIAASQAAQAITARQMVDTQNEHRRKHYGDKCDLIVFTGGCVPDVPGGDVVDGKGAMQIRRSYRLEDYPIPGVCHYTTLIQTKHFQLVVDCNGELDMRRAGDQRPLPINKLKEYAELISRFPDDWPDADLDKVLRDFWYERRPLSHRSAKA